MGAENVSDDELRLVLAEAVHFYEDRYHKRIWFLDGSERYPRIGRANPKHCRFCGRAEPYVTFRNDAHVIPQALGNRVLLSAQECDDCNKFFGDGIEKHFGTWTHPMRTLMRIRGKKHRPTIKQNGPRGWRIGSDEDALYIEHRRDSGVMAIDHENRRMRFHIKRGPYVPVAVLKAFVKMGLGLLDERDLHHFRKALRWIREPDHKLLDGMSHMVGMQQFPGRTVNGSPAAMILMRKDDYKRVPYCFLILGYGSQTFQITIPSDAKDWVLRGFKPLLPAYSTLTLDQIRATGLLQTANIDLSGTSMVTGDVEKFDAKYEDVQETT